MDASSCERPSRTPSSREAGCGAHKSGFVRGAPAEAGAPTRQPAEHAGILDHDGHGQDPGGIEAWIQLGEAVGIARAEMTSLQNVVPGVRFAVDAYVNFARTHPWQETVCASLTELFAPKIHEQRLANWPQHYPWIDPKGLAYFRNRLSEARRDVAHGLALTLDYFDTRPLQERALQILRFKLDVLWNMLDAIQIAYPDEARSAVEVQHG